MEAASSFPVLFHTERRGGSAQVPSNRLILLVGEGGFPRSMCPTNPVGFPLFSLTMWREGGETRSTATLCTEPTTVFSPRGGETRLRLTLSSRRCRGGETRRHQPNTLISGRGNFLTSSRTTRGGETRLMAPSLIHGIIQGSLFIHRRPRGGETRLSSTSCWCLGGETRRHPAQCLI